MAPRAQDPLEESRRMKEFGMALPTSRHVEVFFDTVVDLLGEEAYLEELGGRRLLFRRDPAQPELLLPWPLLVFALGGHLAVRGGLKLSGQEDWEVPGPFEPIAPPSKLRGLRPAEIAVGWGAHFYRAYDDEGRLFEVGRSSSGPEGSDIVLRDALLAMSLEKRGVEGLAEGIVALDVAARAPGRVLVPARVGPTPDKVWVRGLHGMRQALWDRSVPDEDCWLVADGYAGKVVEWGRGCEETLKRWRAAVREHPPRPDPPVEWKAPEPDRELYPWESFDPEREEARARWEAAVSKPTPPPAPAPGPEEMPAALLPFASQTREIPPAHREAGFRRWQPLLGAQGHVAYGLMRDERDEGFTLIGQDILDRFDPATIDEQLEVLDRDGHALAEEDEMQSSAMTGVTRPPQPWRVFAQNWSGDEPGKWSTTGKLRSDPCGLNADTDRARILRVERVS